MTKITEITNIKIISITYVTNIINIANTKQSVCRAEWEERSGLGVVIIVGGHTIYK